MKLNLLSRLAAMLLAAGFLACAGPPRDQLVDVQQRIEAARELRAATYAPTELERAERLWHEAAKLVEEEDRGLLVGYGHARQLLREADAAVTESEQIAAARLVAARGEAERAIAAAHTALDGAKEAFWRTPRGRDTVDDVALMRNDLGRLISRLTVAEVALEQGDFEIASEHAARITAEAERLGDTIRKAMAFRIARLDAG